MKLFAKSCFAVVALGALIAGCGGADTTYSNAAPNYQTLSLDMESNDSGTQAGSALTGVDCHPHLFERTREVVANLNLHIYSVLHRLEVSIDAHPDTRSGTTRTWLRRYLNFDLSATMDEASPGNFSFNAGIAPKGSSSYTPFLTGTLVAGSAPHEGTGTLTMDLTALGSVDPAVLAKGQFTVTYDVEGASKKEVVSFTGYEPPNGFNASDTAIRPPRDGSYTFARTTGVGGSLKFTENVDLLCPHQLDPANPQIATVDTVAVWTHDPSSGDLVGRADSEATGGQIVPGNTWQGVTCFDVNKDSDGTGAMAESYWMMKEEDGTGVTVLAGQVDGTLDVTAADSTTATPAVPPSACNALFGAVPSMTTNASDYSFAAVDFMDDSILAYPGEPDGGI